MPKKTISRECLDYYNLHTIGQKLGLNELLEWEKKHYG